MTEKEAIKILDPATTLEALSEIDYYSGFSGRAARIAAIGEACRLGAEALKHIDDRERLANKIDDLECALQIARNRADTYYKDYEEMRSLNATQHAEIERLRELARNGQHTASAACGILTNKVMMLRAERDALKEAFESFGRFGDTLTGLCEYCATECITAGHDDPETFQCGEFTWRSPLQFGEGGINSGNN